MSKIFTKPFRPLDWAASPHDFAGDNQLGPYQVEETQRYIYGTRYLMWDGRIFKYAASITALKPYHLSGTVDDAADAWSDALATPAGSRSMIITMSNRSEDDLAGGYLQIYDATIDNSVGRGIVGNDATVGTTTIVHLDYPLAVTVVATSDDTEVFENPYKEIRSSDNYVTYMGVAASPVSATGYNFWLQSYGSCIISGGGAALVKDAINNKDVVADAGGCLHQVSTHENYQRIGYMITGAATNLAGPIIMLQLSI